MLQFDRAVSEKVDMVTMDGASTTEGAVAEMYSPSAPKPVVVKKHGKAKADPLVTVTSTC